MRSDIYAFGVILHEMLTGLRRDEGTTAQERIAAMRQRFADGLPPLRTVDETIPEPLAEVVSRCLQRDPAARFQTTAELCAALAALDDTGELIPIPPRLSRTVMAVLALLAIVLVAGTYTLSRRGAVPAKAHDPVSVVIADLRNGTGDAAFDKTLEPILKIALEGAGFINAYDRSGIRRTLGVRPPEMLDERAAQQLAVKEGLGVVLSGSIERQGNRYEVALTVTQAVTGNVIVAVRDRVSTKEQVVGAATKLASSARQALGDNTSGDRFAMETLSATSLEVVRDYAAAAIAMSNGRYDEALGHFSDAAKRDPKFGLAYAGLAISSRNMDKQQDAEKYIKEAVSHLDGMTERERYRTRGLFYMITDDSQQCVRVRRSGDALLGGRVGAEQSGALSHEPAQHAESGRRDAPGRQDPAQTRAVSRQPGAVPGLQRRFQGCRAGSTGDSRAVPVRAARARICAARSEPSGRCRGHLPDDRQDRRARRVVHGVRARRSRVVRGPVRRRRADLGRGCRRRSDHTRPRPRRGQVRRARHGDGLAPAERRRDRRG
jgi:hypothetical protein